MDDEQRRQLLLAELDSTIRKRDAKRFAHKEILSTVLSFTALMALGFGCGIGLLMYFAY